MGTTQGRQVGVLDMFPFRVSAVAACLARNDIPHDVVQYVLTRIKLLYMIEIIEEAQKHGWSFSDGGRLWQHEKEDRLMKLTCSSKALMYDVIELSSERIRIPRALYARCLREKALERCLLCGKKEYYTHCLHPLVLCTEKCVNEYERITGCVHWVPAVSFTQKYRDE